MHLIVSSYYSGVANIVLILHTRNQGINLNSFQSNKWNQVYKNTGIYANYSPIYQPIISHLKVKTVNTPKHKRSNLE